METVADFDVRELLSEVKAPTLVMHVRDNSRVPSSHGRELAAGIPGARFVALPGKNHIPLEKDPGLPRFLEELKDSLKGRLLAGPLSLPVGPFRVISARTAMSASCRLVLQLWTHRFAALTDATGQNRKSPAVFEGRCRSRPQHRQRMTHALEEGLAVAS